MLALIVMIVTHLRDWDVKTTGGTPSHRWKQYKFFFFHVDFEFTQHLLKRVCEAPWDLRMFGMDCFYLSSQLDQLWQFAAVGFVIAG
jgi:hypothetical protein